MTVRNTSNNPLSPSSSRPINTLTTEHAEAIQTLNEQTMKQACDWLLLDDDDHDDNNNNNNNYNDDDNNNNNNNNNDDHHDGGSEAKILEAYYKCESALKILQRQNTPASPLPPGAPILSLAGRAQPRGLPKLAATLKVAKGGVIPMRRTAAMTKPPRMRVESLEADVQSKKARLDARTPPPSALNFLAKLNKDAVTAGGGTTVAVPTITTTALTGSDTSTPAQTKRNPQQIHHRRSSA